MPSKTTTARPSPRLAAATRLFCIDGLPRQSDHHGSAWVRLASRHPRLADGTGQSAEPTSSPSVGLAGVLAFTPHRDTPHGESWNWRGLADNLQHIRNRRANGNSTVAAEAPSQSLNIPKERTRTFIALERIPAFCLDARDGVGGVKSCVTPTCRETPEGVPHRLREHIHSNALED